MNVPCKSFLNITQKKLWRLSITLSPYSKGCEEHPLPKTVENNGAGWCSIRDVSGVFSPHLPEENRPGTSCPMVMSSLISCPNGAMHISLVVEPTHLKNICQIGSFSQVGMEMIKKIFETTTELYQFLKQKDLGLDSLTKPPCGVEVATICPEWNACRKYHDQEGLPICEKKRLPSKTTN